ncbi:MAG TPA: ATP-binding protein, partial [Spirochaetia bacterium]|nr:ATP-binding protein [Spirochaetia bacterium]
MTLRARLTLSYVFIALLCVLMVSALANGVLESSFRRYLENGLRSQSMQVASEVGTQVSADGVWDQQGISLIGMGALEHGLIVKVATADGTVIWDATVHNNGLCQQMLLHMAANMASRYRNWHGVYTEASYPVRTSFRQIGAVTVGYYGPFFLNDEDLSFITALNRLLLWIGLAALVIAVGFGLLMARRITVPLARVVSATQRIAAGSRTVRITEKTRVRELDGIASAVNDLSRSLTEQEQLRRRLTADMAHELRTPLATLQSHLEAMIDGVWQPEPERLGGLHDEILRINRLVTDLENLARYEGRSLSLRRAEIDVADLVQGIVRNHAAQFRAKGVALEFAAEGPLRDQADPDKLSQAVINLLSNALKFTPTGGRVDVRVSGSDSEVRIEVADTGIGISAEDLPRVFERLYRVDESRSRATGG